MLMILSSLYNNGFTQRPQSIYAKNAKRLTMTYLRVLRFSRRTLREPSYIICIECFKNLYYTLFVTPEHLFNFFKA